MRRESSRRAGCSAAPAAWLLGLLALAAAPSAARADADAPGSGGALGLSAEPSRLVLGRDPGADLRIAAPPDVTELSFTASVGRVDGVRRLPGGGFTARYHAPPERHPQVAIVAALARSGAALLDGWLALPLAGRGDARVKGTPGEEVSLRIGDRTFGPERAGRDGVAVIPVVVPPGVREGHQGFTAVDLHVPEAGLVHAVLERSAVQADRPETLRLLAYVVAPHGAARGGEAPLLEATRGAAALRAREPGAFEGAWTLPPGPAGEERLTVRLDGFPASRVVLRVAGAPGAASAVAVSFDRPALTAGEDEVAITARAVDAAGNTTASPVTLSADAGALTQEQLAPGVVRGRLRVDPRFGGREQLRVRARALATGATGEAALPLQPAPPARAVLRPAHAFTPSDGRTDAVLTLELRDAHGNLTAGAPRLTASAGPPPRLEPLTRGRFRVRWHAEALDPPPAALEAAVGEVRARAHVWSVPPARRQHALLAGVGLLRPGSDAGGAFLAGAELPLPAPASLPAQRALGLRVELLGAAWDRRRAGPDERARAAAILAGPVLRGMLPPARWFASATAGALVGSADPSGGPPRAALVPALRLGVGLAAPLARTAPYLELSYLAAGRTPAGGGGALLLTFGVRHDAVRPRAAAAEE